MRNLVLLLGVLVLFSFCKKKQTDREKIDAYITANNLKGNYTSSGLYFVVDVPGPWW